MQITLQNIGIIEDSTIRLDGLTVITGQNNSGKTTVGKALYSLFDAVANLQNKAQNDKLHYAQKKLDEIENVLGIFRFIRMTDIEKIAATFDKDSSFIKFISRSYKLELPNSQIEQFAHSLYKELSDIDFRIIGENEIWSNYYSHFMRRGYDKTSWAEKLQKQQKESLEILNRLFKDLNNDPMLIDYARACINQTLRVEFSNQIQPVSIPVEKSKIELIGNDSVLFELEIIGNKVVNDGNPVFTSSPYPKVYFIDDPFIIDSLSQKRYVREQETSENENTDTLLNARRISTHDDKLRSVLKSGKTPSVFEETLLNSSLASIKEQIDQVIPGEFEFGSEGEYYIQSGNKLKVSNLAAGSKMFSIIKILLERGEIDAGTMLILDEPEAHLHPHWQNKFAEIIVLLVKELDVNVLLTTHSSNFMLAIDAYMRKHNISAKTNFYQTGISKNGLVEYNCVNDDMGKIYADFMKYLSEVKVLRNEYVNNYGE